MWWSAPPAAGQEGCSRRRCREKTRPEWVPVPRPSVSYRAAFPAGVVVETINGCIQPAGTVRFFAGRQIYLDGSAAAPGTFFATASAALRQVAPDGAVLGMQIALEDFGPRSAVAGEMRAYSMLIMGLKRGLIGDGDDEELKVPVYVDCKAVILAAEKPGHWSSERFAFGGWWVDLPAVRDRIGGPHKVDAHRPRQQAAAEGWEEHWLGNDAVDGLAKDCRPLVHLKAATAWTRWQRARPKQLEEAMEGAAPHPWQCLKVLERLPREVLNRRNVASACHVPAWRAGQWRCVKCGVGLRGAAAAEAASRTPCPTTFGARLHSSHSLSVGTLRRSARDEGTPIAVCRRCGCYSSHAAVGLSRVCDAGLRGRRSKLKRFLRGLHPEPGGKHADSYIDNVRSYGRGKFQPAGSQLLVAERAAGLRLGSGAAGAAADSAEDVPPPPAPFRTELEALAEMERLELEAADACEEDYGDLEDVFGHMGEDFGTDTGRPGRREGIVAEELHAEAGGPAASQGVAGPPAKRMRIVGKRPPQGGPTVQNAVTVSPASLEGLELRLATAGEVPRFKVSDRGGLVHECGLHNAAVRFWPSTLAWSVEGPDCGKVEALLLAPLLA